MDVVDVQLAMLDNKLEPHDVCIVIIYYVKSCSSYREHSKSTEVSFLYHSLQNLILSSRVQGEAILDHYFLHNQMEPNENDVLSGRGAGFNQHPGNEKFRKMIDKQKVRQPQFFLLCFCPYNNDFK